MRAKQTAHISPSSSPQHSSHLPVMWAQVMEGLQVLSDGRYLDGTFGRGGHARGVLDRLGAKGKLLLMDKDPEAIAEAVKSFGNDARVVVRQGSFANLADWDETEPVLNGVLFDLGVSSPQLDNAERGFSFRHDGLLDMRMDPSTGESAATWLARADEREIADVLWVYGEEKMSRCIARAIVAHRAITPLVRTAQLAELIANIVGRGDSRICPGTHRKPRDTGLEPPGFSGFCCPGGFPRSGSAACHTNH